MNKLTTILSTIERWLQKADEELLYTPDEVGDGQQAELPIDPNEHHPELGHALCPCQSCRTWRDEPDPNDIPLSLPAYEHGVEYGRMVGDVTHENFVAQLIRLHDDAQASLPYGMRFEIRLDVQRCPTNELTTVEEYQSQGCHYVLCPGPIATDADHVSLGPEYTMQVIGAEHLQGCAALQALIRGVNARYNAQHILDAIPRYKMAWYSAPEVFARRTVWEAYTNAVSLADTLRRWIPGWGYVLVGEYASLGLGTIPDEARRLAGQSRIPLLEDEPHGRA